MLKQLSQLQETILDLLAANPEGLRHCQICTKLRQTGDTHRRETIRHNVLQLTEKNLLKYTTEYKSVHLRYRKAHNQTFKRFHLQQPNLTRKHYHLLNQIEVTT